MGEGGAVGPADELEGHGGGTPGGHALRKLFRQSAEGTPTGPFARGGLSPSSSNTLNAKFGIHSLPRWRNLSAMYLALAGWVGAFALWVVDPDGFDPVDALYMSVSVLSGTGLCIVNYTDRPWGVYVVTLCILISTSWIPMSVVPTGIRYLQARRLTKGRRLGGSAFFGIYTSGADEAKVLLELLRVVLLYWLVMQLVGWIFLWIILRAADLGGAGDAFFLALSAFHNCGLLTLASLPLKGSYAAPWLLLVMSCLILGGNTWYPIAMRAALVGRQRSARDPHTARVLGMLLQQPRTCYTHVFSHQFTITLSVILALLIIGQIGTLALVDFWAEPANGVGETQIMAGLSGPERALGIVFQAISTRTAGFAVLDLSKLSKCSAFVIMVCMWISTCPVVVAMRSSTQQSHTFVAPDNPDDVSWNGMVRAQTGHFLRENAALLAALFFIVLVSEEYASTTAHVRDNDFIMICFEFCSAYGTSGLSMSGGNSRSESWVSTGKLALTGVMFLGRMRGLPEAQDPAANLQCIFDIDGVPAKLRKAESQDLGQEEQRDPRTPRKIHFADEGFGAFEQPPVLEEVAPDAAPARPRSRRELEGRRRQKAPPPVVDFYLCKCSRWWSVMVGACTT